MNTADPRCLGWLQYPPDPSYDYSETRGLYQTICRQLTEAEEKNFNIKGGVDGSRVWACADPWSRPVQGCLSKLVDGVMSSDDAATINGGAGPWKDVYANFFEDCRSGNVETSPVPAPKPAPPPTPSAPSCRYACDSCEEVCPADKCSFSCQGCACK